MKKMREYRMDMTMDERRKDHYLEFKWKKDENELEYFPASIVEKTFNDGKSKSVAALFN